jgi:hypothetical protein
MMGELLLQVTQSQGLGEALQKVLRDYVELKLATLSAEIRLLAEQWGRPLTFTDISRPGPSHTGIPGFGRPTEEHDLTKPFIRTETFSSCIVLPAGHPWLA